MAAGLLNEISITFTKFIAYPITFSNSVLANITLEWLKLNEIYLGGGTVKVNMLWPLIKWSIFLLAIAALVIFILIDTCRRVFYVQEKTMTVGRLLSNLIVLALVLGLYYLLAAGALYVFFNLLLPLYQSINE
jgi:hypothetical protein